jgi:NodT family efflux transporter outer membrane factor (OMF) lipoprotein
MFGGCLAALMVVMMLSGCSHLGHWATNGFKVGPDYAQPAAPIAHNWIDMNDPRVISASCGVDDSQWWSVFGDPHIDFLIWTAYRQNLPLKEAAIRVQEAQSQRSIAVGLLFPQSQEAYADYYRIQVSKNGGPAGLFQLVPFRAFDFWNTGFNISWELDVWGKVRRSIEAQDAKLDASIENYDDVLVCLVAETARTYIEIREFQQRLRIARENVEIQKESLRFAEVREEKGRSDGLDVAQAKATVAYTEAMIPLLETGLRLANNRLCILLGMPPYDMERDLGIGPIPQAPPQVVVGIPAELLRRRPDVRRAEREVAEESARIGVATSLLFPAFSIDGNLSWQSEKLSNLFDPASSAGFVNPGVNWQILNYGRIMHLIELQDAKFQRTAVHYQQVVLEAGAETEDAIKSFLEAQKRVATLQVSVSETSTAVRLATKIWEEGPAGGDAARDLSGLKFNRLAGLQTSLAVQEDTLAMAKARVAIELVKIYKSLGGGWQMRLVGCDYASRCAMPPLMPELLDGTAPETLEVPQHPAPNEPENEPLPPVDNSARELPEADFIVFPRRSRAPETTRAGAAEVDVRLIEDPQAAVVRRLPADITTYRTAPSLQAASLPAGQEANIRR